MDNDLTSFGRDGYMVIEKILDLRQCEELILALPEIENSGSRTLLSDRPFRELARDLRNLNHLRRVLANYVAVQCTLFRKSLAHNWAVRLHRDAVIPVRGVGPWKSAGMKEEMHTAKPPRTFLDDCVAVRVHLDGAPGEDICVVPGSHQDSKTHTRSEVVAVPVSRGGGLIMRPTLAHASSRLRDSENRRVLHYLFARPDLPSGYSWYHAI